MIPSKRPELNSQVNAHNKDVVLSRCPSVCSGTLRLSLQEGQHDSAGIGRKAQKQKATEDMHLSQYRGFASSKFKAAPGA